MTPLRPRKPPGRKSLSGPLKPGASPRLTISLTHAQAAVLDLRAAQYGCSKADLVRRIIERFLKSGG